MNFISLFNLPNILTLVNLFSGCIAVIFIFNYRVELVPYCVLASLIADFLDGFAARFTNNPTNLGKQLDSLADVVSFGLVPGAILFQLLFQKYESSQDYYSTTKMYLYSAPAFLITLCAALRLAKFNIDERQHDSFIGLATPAATIFVIGYLLTFIRNSFGLAPYIFDVKVIYSIVLVLSVLMLAEIPMFSLKFKSFGWKGNETVYLFIILSLILLVSLRFAGIAPVIVLYVVVSLVANELKKATKTQGN